MLINKLEIKLYLFQKEDDIKVAMCTTENKWYVKN